MTGPEDLVFGVPPASARPEPAGPAAGFESGGAGWPTGGDHGDQPRDIEDGGGAGRRQRHESWMRRALDISVDGPKVTAGGSRENLNGPAVDIPVGAVLLGPDGTELAVGRNERELTGDPTGHAEILALRRAAAATGSWRLDGCTLVVTLEPCTMCAGALVLARIGTLVFGAWEPKTGAVGSLWDVVRDRRLNHRPDVYGGVLDVECAAVLRAFFR